MALTTQDKTAIAELAQDAVAAMFAKGAHKGIAFAYNDTAGSMTATVAQVAGAATFGAMTDRASVNLPTMNTPLKNDLKTRAVMLKPPRDQNTSAVLPVTDALVEYVNNAGTADVVYTINGNLGWPAFSLLEFRQGSTGTVEVMVTGGTFSVFAGTRTLTAGPGDRLRFQCIHATPGANVWEWV